MNLTDFAITLPFFLVFLVFFNRYFFGLFIKRLGIKFPENQISRNRTQPTVAIVIPLYNEGASIYSTLVSLTKQTYPKEKLKIAVVDDCSKDDSATWAQRAAKESDQIIVMRNPTNIGKRLAIARAVRELDAEIIISVDSDVIVSDTAVAELVSCFESPQIAAVGGKVNVINCNENWLSKMQTIKYFFGYEYLKNLEGAFYNIMCLSGCLTAYRRSVLIELEPILENRGLFGIPIKYGEDRFLTRQIIKAGYLTRLNLNAVCYTKVPTKLAGYFSQQLRWRRSNLVDFFGGVTHVWQLNPFVAIHYLAINSVLCCYPIFLWTIFSHGKFFESTTLHLGILGIYSWIYYFKTRDLEPKYRVNPVHFLWMSVLMPVTYMVLTVLALLTLHSSSWETRKVVAKVRAPGSTKA